MNEHEILITIQYVTVLALFTELIIVLFKRKNSIHVYLFLACIATFISNLGYLFELNAMSEETYLTALKFSYTGRVWIVFAFFLFAAKISGIKVPRWMLIVLVFVHIGIYASVITIGSNDLFYSSYEFVPDLVYPKFYRTPGVMHDLLITLNVILVGFGFVWVLRDFLRETKRKSKLKFLTLLIAFGVQFAAFLLQVIGVFPISKYYDITMPASLFGTICFFIAIFGFDLLGTKEIAKDFVIDRISEGIIVLDNSGRIQFFNEPVTKLYPEFDRFYLPKNRRRKLISNNEETSEKPEINKKASLTPYDIVDTIKEAASNNKTVTINERIYSPEENELVYKGENYGKLYALVDDTEHFRYIEDLQEQKDIADNANEAKSKFLANMSHEIRTPINAMIGMDEMILRESKEKSIRTYASDIMSAGKTLLSLINDILDLSKVEEGKMDIIPVQYDLSSLINDLVNMIYDRASKKGLKFNVDVEKSIPSSLYGDEIRIRQCVMNLLTNSVKYTNEGEVTLSISHNRINDNKIALSFMVKDTGIGMKKEDMDKLFTPYKRIEEKRNRTIEGTGLGMSITRQLLDLMGSSLEVQSVYGEGSTFSFTIEQEFMSEDEIGDYSIRYEDALKDSYVYHELFVAPDAKILVVDDTEVNLVVVKNLLKNTKIQIDTCMSGKEAIKLANENKYDAVFIDHMMPDMDGIETLSHIRKSGKCMDVPSVALTANAVSGAREMYQKAGFTNYMSKPIDGLKLEELLYDILPKDKLNKPDIEDDFETDVNILDDEEATDDIIPHWLYDAQEIDVQSGVSNTGSKDAYMSVLSVFNTSIEENASEIEAAYNNADWKNYTIKVHALKSSARIIGAKELSNRAKKLEEAGNKEDISYIEGNTNELLIMYRELNKKLSMLNQRDEELPDISPDELREAYLTIYEMSKAMDYGFVENVLNELRRYNIPSDDKKTIDEIDKMLTKLDWDEITRITKEKI